MTVGWTEPKVAEGKKPLTYGLGYVEGYQDGYHVGYDVAYNNKESLGSDQLFVKTEDKTEYLQGVREGFKKGYQDGFEKGTEDHQRYVEKKWMPESKKQVRVWKYQWGYFGGYWNLTETHWVRKGDRI